MGARTRTTWTPLVATLAAVLAVDWVTKLAAVRSDGEVLGHGLIYNPDIPPTWERLTVVAATLVVVSLITRVAERRGAGPVPAVWVAGGLLIGGTLGNWSSGLVWDAGVPDFIARGERMWNLADFAIGNGMLLFLASTVFYAVRSYARARASAGRVG